MQMSKWHIFVVFSLSILIFSCAETVPKPDVSAVSVDYTSHRFDRAFFYCNFEDSAAIQSLYRDYGDFLVEYVEGIMALGPVDSVFSFSVEAAQMTTMPDIVALEAEVNRVFDDNTIASLDADFEEAFRYYRHYFPEDTMPKIIYMNTIFNYGIYPMDKYLGIGLDFFLGPDNEFIRSLPPDVFPQYQRDKMRPDYIVPNAMFGHLAVKHQDLYNESNLLETMIFYGKMMYILDLVLPDMPDSLKMNYSSREMEWAKAYEYNTWKELANEKVLYNGKAADIRRWVNDGPFTNAGNIPNDSPSRLGIFMGRQMVWSYIKKNEEVSLHDLIYKTKSEEILRHYKPKK